MATVEKNAYKVLFFDLDHTLWDYNTSARETLEDLYQEYLFGHAQFTFDSFLDTFHKVNQQLWHQYNKGQIDKDQIRDKRFDQILNKLNFNDIDLSSHISTKYLFECPRKPNLIPKTLEVLDVLKEKYQMHILTNGFDDVQAIKLESSKIHGYFNKVITSDGCGYKKPDPLFFHHALKACNCSVDESLMIGDNLKTDISGALGVGIDTVYYNASKNGRPHKSTYEIDCLSQLLQIV